MSCDVGEVTEKRNYRKFCDALDVGVKILLHIQLFNISIPSPEM